MSREGGEGVTITCMAVVCRTIDSRTPSLPGPSRSGVHRPGRQCVHQARSAVRCEGSEGGGGVCFFGTIVSALLIGGDFSLELRTPSGGAGSSCVVMSCVCCDGGGRGGLSYGEGGGEERMSLASTTSMRVFACVRANLYVRACVRLSFHSCFVRTGSPFVLGKGTVGWGDGGA